MSDDKDQIKDQNKGQAEGTAEDQAKNPAEDQGKDQAEAKAETQPGNTPEARAKAESNNPGADSEPQSGINADKKPDPSLQPVEGPSAVGAAQTEPLPQSQPQSQPLAVQQAEIVSVRKGMFPGDGGDTSGYGRLVRKIELPGQSPRPYGGYFDEVENELFGALDEQGLRPEDAIERVIVHGGQLTFQVRREHLVQVARVLRDDPALRFELCLGVSGVHFPHEAGRELHSFAPLMSVTHNRRIQLETTCPDADPHIPSLYQVYPAVDWHEREAWDMFGIVYDGHPALTRILMPDDWPGHPQRKDYPLGGIPVEFKGAQIPAPDQRRSYS